MNWFKEKTTYTVIVYCEHCAVCNPFDSKFKIEIEIEKGHTAIGKTTICDNCEIKGVISLGRGKDGVQRLYLNNLDKFFKPEVKLEVKNDKKNKRK